MGGKKIYRFGDEVKPTPEIGPNFDMTLSKEYLSGVGGTVHGVEHGCVLFIKPARNPVWWQFDVPLLQCDREILETALTEQRVRLSRHYEGDKKLSQIDIDGIKHKIAVIKEAIKRRKKG